MRVKVIVWNFVQIDWGGFWVLILETSFCCYVMILHDMVHEGFGSLNGLGGGFATPWAVFSTCFLSVCLCYLGEER